MMYNVMRVIAICYEVWMLLTFAYAKLYRIVYTSTKLYALQCRLEGEGRMANAPGRYERNELKDVTSDAGISAIIDILRSMADGCAIGYYPFVLEFVCIANGNRERLECHADYFLFNGINCTYDAAIDCAKRIFGYYKNSAEARICISEGTNLTVFY